MVSHGTAAAFHGLWDKWPVLIDVTVPVEAGRKIDGIRCRRCRYPQPEEIEVRNGVACTTVARTLVDLAGMVGLKTLRKTVGRAAIRKKLDLDAVELAIHNAKRRRGLRILELALVPYRTKDGEVPDLRSDFETLVLPQLLGMGLPRPECNAPLHVEGERFLVDFLHRLPLEEPIERERADQGPGVVPSGPSRFCPEGATPGPLPLSLR